MSVPTCAILWNMYSATFIDDATLVGLAAEQAALLPAGIRDRVEAFRSGTHPSGSLLLRGLPVGALPPTPATPTDQTNKSNATEVLLLAVGCLLGEPVGYEPEHGGDVVQNIVPVRESSDRQTSTSSKVNLMFHTEAAFHPHRPKYLLLLCLRGDPGARTTVASIHAALPHLETSVIEVLFQRRFRCAVDESYLHGRSNELGAPIAVLSGSYANPAMVFDEDLMVGIDEEAERALHLLGEALTQHHDGVVLEAGDLVIIDNDMVVHGRSPFTPRFDGTDRWLQRAFVGTDLAASEGERTGRMITTVFGV